LATPFPGAALVAIVTRLVLACIGMLFTHFIRPANYHVRAELAP
jgi:hypothetical protein